MKCIYTLSILSISTILIINYQINYNNLIICWVINNDKYNIMNLLNNKYLFLKQNIIIIISKPYKNYIIII